MAAGKQGKGKKLRRCSKHQGMYKQQYFQSETNKKKFLGRHIRNNPGDLQAIKRYEVDMGSADGNLGNLTAKGKKLADRL